MTIHVIKNTAMLHQLPGSPVFLPLRESLPKLNKDKIPEQAVSYFKEPTNQEHIV